MKFLLKNSKLLTTVVITVFFISSCNNNPKPPVIKDTTSPIPETPDIKKQTVLIIGTSPSSGVIISSKDNQYYILTAKHNVEDIPLDLSNSFQVETYDGEKYKFDYTKVRTDPILDLAIIEFTSDKKYSVASLSKDLKQDTNVYISGWKDCSEPQYEFNKGQVLQVISSSSEVNNNKQSQEQEYEDEDFQEGYIVEYTNKTINGMSGGPVFDNTGHVIAVHGKSGHKKQYNPEECNSLTEDFRNNWGIPIEKFLQSSLSSGIGLPEDNNSTQNNSVTSNSNTNKPTKTQSSDPSSTISLSENNNSVQNNSNTNEPNKTQSSDPLESCTLFCRPEKHK